MSNPKTFFDFDEVINRRAVPALKMHPNTLGKNGENHFAEDGIWKNNIFFAPECINALAIAVSKFTDKGDGVIVQPSVF